MQVSVMSKIEIIRHTSLEAGTAFEKIKTAMSDDSQMKQWDPSYRCEFQESTIHIKGKHLDATITVNPSDQVNHNASKEDVETVSTISIQIHLPLMLSPFKKLVKTNLEKKLDKTFGKKIF